ncbi:hypothetical protein OM427_07590 [Halomonas sp. 18H]|uniref:hypothetical protein n=1 Tax=Halomonas almeriensis TaxID=308163 RepID=UPI0022307C9B|nr:MULTISPECIES: hypothetical protein [Halomonas]MCW4149394.1 hypothetical protein [Halomonas sp. 18H]MDN3553660.1 hypothetical protein [Halomonas almeriensis]
MEDLFALIGNALGEGIRLIVELLGGLFRHADDAVDGLFSGLSRSLGISTSWVSLALLIFGLWMLWRGFSALLQRAYLATLLWWLLAMMVLGWLIN